MNSSSTGIHEDRARKLDATCKIIAENVNAQILLRHQSSPGRDVPHVLENVDAILCFLYIRKRIHFEVMKFPASSFILRSSAGGH